MRIDNEFTVISGANMANHTASLQGRGKYVTVGMGVPPTMRTRDEVYRFIAHLMLHTERIDLPSETLSDEGDPYTLDDYLDAITLPAQTKLADD